MYSAYFDESGTHDSKVLVIGCAISNDKKWAYFQKEWGKYLQSLGLDYFHMTDFENRQGPYKDWNKDKRIKVLTDLFEIIHKRVDIFITVAIFLDDFPFIKETLSLPSHHNPFRCGLYESFRLIKEWRVNNACNEPMALIFEDGNQYKGEIKKLFEEVRLDRNFRSLDFKNKDTNSLHVADILAYEGYKEAVNAKITPEPKKPVRQSIQSLLRLKDKKYSVILKKPSDKEKRTS